MSQVMGHRVQECIHGTRVTRCGCMDTQVHAEVEIVACPDYCHKKVEKKEPQE